MTVFIAIVAVFGVLVMLFLKDMSDNALMGASPKYKANLPAIPSVDITQAPQCAQGYDKTWVGCQKLAE